jgi:RimJ/RimL family protein N-acetyltransferase
MEALLRDPDVLRFTRVPDPPPPGFARAWLDRYLAADGCAGFAAEDAEGRFLGLGVAPFIDGEAGEIELGYITAPEARGRGVAAALLARLTRWALEDAGAVRVTLLIDTDNPASERVAERCGYVREGVMRSVHLKQGRRIEQAMWSRLPSDPAMP